METTSEKLTYLNTTKTLIKEKLNLGGVNITTQPFRAYSTKLMDLYKDFLANGLGTLWNNWEKVSGESTSLSLTPTIKGKMAITLKGNTYQNGTPSLDNPNVHVVSGNNTITIGDEVNSTSYSINLGTIELCKIGNYQDYVYKNNGKWYVHKEIGKVVLGSTSYSRLITNYSNVEYIEINKPSNFLGYNSYDKVEIKCDKATWMATATGGWDNAQNIGKISGNAHNLCWWMGFSKNTGIDNIKTQLEDAIIYYPLATPTTNEITDTTLIEQLNNIENATSYDNQTNISQTNNDLGFIISVSALKDIS